MSPRRSSSDKHPGRPQGARGVGVSSVRRGGSRWRPVVGGVVIPITSPEPAATVMIADNDVLTRRRLCEQLSAHGLRCVEVKAVVLLEERALEIAPELILLDLDHAWSDGIALLRHFRAQLSTPLIVLSSRKVERDKVAALDAGADDYITKPCGEHELVARIRAALRRAKASSSEPSDRPSPVIEVGPLRIDPIAQEAVLAGEVLALTRLELRLLTALAHNAGRVLTPHQLATAVWGPDSTGEAQSLRVYIARLRQLLERDPSNPRWLVTRLRVGYCLRREPDE